MSGLRTNAAAELLGVSPNTLRSWERRFGYPSPRRSAGGHRRYELTELEPLRAALAETGNISSAIELARRRGEGPASGVRLIQAFDRFDESAADRVMEESLAVRSVERTVEELVLPALEAAGARPGREAEHELACRWAAGWLHAARRIVPPATRAEGVLLLDASSAPADIESVHAQALELCLRRAGFKVLLLSSSLPRERLGRALRALGPFALVLCGSQATLDDVGTLVHAARKHQGAEVFEYREATPVSGGHAIRSLGHVPLEAVAALRAFADAAPDARPEGARRPVAIVS